MTHIHTWLKKETVLLPAISFCHLSGGLASEHFWSRFFFFFYLSSFYCTSSHFIQSQKKKMWCCFTLAVVFFFFSHEYIFWVKHFQFLLVIFRYLIQGGIWNTQALLSHIVSLVLSLTTVIGCGFPSLPEPHVQTYARHFHMYTQKKKKPRHTSDRSSSISVCLDTTGPLPPNQTHPPPTHFILELHTETKDEFWGIFV